MPLCLSTVRQAAVRPTQWKATGTSKQLAKVSNQSLVKEMMA